MCVRTHKICFDGIARFGSSIVLSFLRFAHFVDLRSYFFAVVAAVAALFEQEVIYSIRHFGQNRMKAAKVLHIFFLFSPPRRPAKNNQPMIWNVKWRKSNNIDRIKFMLHRHNLVLAVVPPMLLFSFTIFYLNRFWRLFDARTRARARSRTWTHFFKWFLQHCCGARKTTTMCLLRSEVACHKSGYQNSR